MSCNACRVLRKGCSDTCILRPCLQSIDTAESQGHATLFLAKFFGRAALMSFISAVPEIQRPALFQSLLFEAAGRTVNPINGAVGLLWTGNWHVCQAAVETVLRGGALRPIAEFFGGESEPDDASECTDMFKLQEEPTGMGSRPKERKRRRLPDEVKPELGDLDLGSMPVFSLKKKNPKRRTGSRSMHSEESLTTTCGDEPVTEIKLLKLF